MDGNPEYIVYQVRDVRFSPISRWITTRKSGNTASIPFHSDVRRVERVSERGWTWWPVGAGRVLSVVHNPVPIADRWCAINQVFLNFSFFEVSVMRRPHPGRLLLVAIILLVTAIPAAPRLSPSRNEEVRVGKYASDAS